MVCVMVCVIVCVCVYVCVWAFCRGSSIVRMWRPCAPAPTSSPQTSTGTRRLSWSGGWCDHALVFGRLRLMVRHHRRLTGLVREQQAAPRAAAPLDASERLQAELNDARQATRAAATVAAAERERYLREMADAKDQIDRLQERLRLSHQPSPEADSESMRRKGAGRGGDLSGRRFDCVRLR
jgi:hypothetical protein